MQRFFSAASQNRDRSKRHFVMRGLDPRIHQTS
jgi:hypothetical protein